MNKPYGPEEKEYLTMKRLGLSEARWVIQSSVLCLKIIECCT